MGLTLEDKKVVVGQFTQRLETAQALVVAEYRGMNAESMTALRRLARENGIYLLVMKNTLVGVALRGTAFEEFTSQLTGPLVYAVTDDFLAASKILHQYAEKNERFVLRSAMMNGSLLSVDDIVAYAKLPTYEEIMGQLMGAMQAPIVQAMRVMKEVPSKFVRTLAAYRDSIS